MFASKFFRITGLLVLTLVIVVLTGCRSIQPTQTNAGGSTPAASMPNPAAVFCQEQGGKNENRTDASGGQYGVCLFSDGSECDQWAYYRGECQPRQITQTLTPQSVPAYTNQAFGFTFAVPAGWTLEEYPDYLLFTQPGYRLFVGFQSSGEEPKPFRTGMPEGEFVDAGTALLLGQPIPKQNLVLAGKIKVVSYGGRMEAGSLVLVFYLDAVEYTQVSYADLDIPAEVTASAEQIIASFAFTSGEIPVLEYYQP